MRKVIVIIGVVIAILAIGYMANLKYTKSFSPESVAKYNRDGLSINVYYSQPSRKGRLIFGSVAEALVPYGKLWRTGANEATEIEFNKPLSIAGQKLAAGRYTLFTIPNEDHWTVIFNTELGQWGVFTYEEKDDLLTASAIVEQKEDLVEMFTINFEEDRDNVNLVMSWAHTKAILPLHY